MAKETEGVGSDKSEMKTLLKLAKRKPIHMAFALDSDGKAVVQMHKMKPPRALEKGLKEGVQGGKNHRFGTIMVDPEFPKVAKFVVNKAVGGIARKLVIALKGTGFSKIQIVTEQGEALEDAEGEDEEQEEDEDEGGNTEDEGEDEPHRRPQIHLGNDEETTSRRAQPDDEITPEGNDTPTAYTDPEYEQPDSEKQSKGNGEDDSQEVLRLLKIDLTDLVKEMLGVIKRDPTAKTALAELATDAQASLKRGDVDQASAGIDILRQAIDSYSENDGEEEEEKEQEGEGEEEQTPADASADEGGSKNGEDSQQANGKDGKASVQKFHKSRVAWTATRAKVDTELQKLSKAIMDASAGEDMVEGLEDQFFKVVDPVLAELDESLSDTLSAAADADGEEREQLMDQARKTIARYTKFVESNSIISDLDNNPFVPLAIGKTLTGTLSTLTSIMR